MPHHGATSEEPIVLCCDLDGTLVATDTVVEACFRLLKLNPLYLFLFPLWLVEGLAYFKRRIVKCLEKAHAELDVKKLPYRSEVLQILTDAKAKGLRTVLATASDMKIALSVAEHLQLFDEVFASDGTVNLKGENKRGVLSQRFGIKGYDYIGDSEADYPVWREAAGAYVVGTLDPMRISGAVLRKQIPSSTRSWWKSLLHALRVVQWVKNILVLVPLFAAHEVFATGIVTPYLFFDGIVAALSISLIASGVYVLNDLFDLDADRAHSRKKRRPFAAGELSIPFGLLLAPLLMITGLTIGGLFSADFVLVLLSYVVLTTLYTTIFKRLVLCDVIVLAALYTLRIFGGGVALHIPISPWLMALSMFLFFSLACIKRLAELQEANEQSKVALAGRGYRASDVHSVAQVCAASSCCSVLVLVLYANDSSINGMYSHPKALWCGAPFLLYWLLRLLLLAQRGEIKDDPVVFALKDRASYVAALAMLAGMIGAL